MILWDKEGGKVGCCRISLYGVAGSQVKRQIDLASELCMECGKGLLQEKYKFSYVYVPSSSPCFTTYIFPGFSLVLSTMNFLVVRTSHIGSPSSSTSSSSSDNAAPSFNRYFFEASVDLFSCSFLIWARSAVAALSV